MFFGDKKRKVGSIAVLASLKPDFSSSSESDYKDHMLNAASEEILGAVVKGDSKMLKEALKNFLKFCEEEENEEYS